jgi:hypothetical protein
MSAPESAKFVGLLNRRLKAMRARVFFMHLAMPRPQLWDGRTGRTEASLWFGSELVGVGYQYV